MSLRRSSIIRAAAVVWGLAMSLQGCDRGEKSPEPAATASTPSSAASATDSEPQWANYNEARRDFVTRLKRLGPAPETDAGKPPTPPGAEAITYNSGGLELTAWISAKPAKGAGKRPAVLYLHPGFSVEKSTWSWTEPYREAGYVVLVPWLRAENGQPGAYSMFLHEVDDVVAAAEQLALIPYVDDQHIYIAGHSVGGTLAMLAAMRSKRFRAGVAFSGSPDQEAWSRGQPEVIPFDPDVRDEYRIRSPKSFPGSFKCPMRLYYGDQEALFKRTIPPFAAAAETAHRDVKAVEVPGDHISHVSAAMDQSIQFFKAH